MTITSEMVRQLREKTGVGMMDCKKALEETKGDMEAAIDHLRKKGLASAAKKAGRITAEGLATVIAMSGGKKVAAVEVNCETDFVAKNEDFISFVKDIGEMACQSSSSTAETLLEAPFSGKYLKEKGVTKDVLTALIARIGENLVLRRVKTFEASGNEVVGQYVHGNGRVAVLVKARFKNAANASKGEGEQLLKDVCMQVAAAKPEFLDPKAVPAARMDREKEIYLQQAMETGKPREIAEKIVAGKMSKFYNEVCLLQQPFVKDPDLTVEKHIAKFNKANGEEVTLVDFVRFALGEGIEKKSADFASEVAALQKS